MGRVRLAFAAAAGTGLLAACQPASTPAPQPPGRPVSSTPTAALAPSADSQRARAYYARVQANLLSQGLLRTDGGSADTPFTTEQLVENFERIALFDEYVADNGSLVARTTASPLRRWEKPIRMGIEFGPSVSPAQAARDRGNITAYATRLARLTGRPITVGDARPNFSILFLNEDERRAAGPRLAELVPGIDATAVAAITEMPPSTYCLVFAFSVGPAAAYTQAVAVVRAEHPDLLRLSCIHEELAQGLGLANDSPSARPSIFNDDEEFALLTRQDELMLRILYDRRLKPGMTADEARPIVERIAAELIAGGSG
ncbi:MAG: DUF2927 domain-containing protein [Pseudomonadota bacterium]